MFLITCQQCLHHCHSRFDSQRHVPGEDLVTTSNPPISLRRSSVPLRADDDNDVAISASFRLNFLSHKPCLRGDQDFEKVPKTLPRPEKYNPRRKPLKSRDPRLCHIVPNSERKLGSSNLADLQAQTVFNAAKNHVKDNGQLPLSRTKVKHPLYRQLRTKWERPQTPIGRVRLQHLIEWADGREVEL